MVWHRNHLLPIPQVGESETEPSSIVPASEQEESSEIPDAVMKNNQDLLERISATTNGDWWAPPEEVAALKRHCYQALEKSSTKEESSSKIRVLRSASEYVQGGLKPITSGICSTWGNFHFKTFDGEVFRFPGLCNYIFASHCGKLFEDFNIQIQQFVVDKLPTITQVSIKINGLVVELKDHYPTIHGEPLELPFSQSGIQIEQSDEDLKVTAKMILVLIWHNDNSINLKLNKKYMGETCGLCSDYNGNPKNDFVFKGRTLTPIEFGIMHKLRLPEQTCVDPKPETGEECFIYRAMCIKLLRNSKWTSCNMLVKAEPYIEAYMHDMCLCNASVTITSFCLCNTITEYSRQCAIAGGRPPEWRNPALCFKKCNFNLIYKECSSPCAPTCSNPGRPLLCDGSCEAGCDCPNGYVLDDITNSGCLPIENCSCSYNNEVYPPGSSYQAPCYTCKKNTLDVTYSTVVWSLVLSLHLYAFLQVEDLMFQFNSFADNAFLVTIEMQKCGYGESSTCIIRVVLALNKGAAIFEINYDKTNFPHTSYDKEEIARAGVNIFWPSSFFMIVQTNKGLQLQVQLTPIMQLYVILDPSYKRKTCGLCGNFNDIQRDDFRTSSGAIEVNIAEFANTWKTQYSCNNVKNIPEHPCTLGMEIETYMGYCPPSFVYSYTVTSCIPTCRSLSEPDPTCSIKFFPVDGCVCKKGTYLDDNGVCVHKDNCPCYYRGVAVSANNALHVGRLICVCNNRTWVCDTKADMGICTIYGEGHYITFDSKHYTVNGDCEYTLVQDYCNIYDLRKGTFRVIIENIPCGTTGTSCSKAIIVYVGTHKLILTDEHIEVVEIFNQVEIPYKVRRMGIFLVIEASNGLVLVWDRMTSIFIHLSRNFKGNVCGLCGNFDGNSNNDFTTRSQCVVEDVTEFRDSWKLSPTCPEVLMTKDPCTANPYRKAWATKICNLITSDVFSACHSEVDPDKYYEGCVSDTCACDTGGDCNCYCTAIAAYSQACSEACVCVKWRTPTICPVFCDLYNGDGQCEWHYRPCGASCMKTCKNPSGECLYKLKGLEGCYPKCPEDKPYFDEDEMQCVAQCGCLLNEDKYYELGEKVESCNSCEICLCTTKGILCHYDIAEENLPKPYIPTPNAKPNPCIPTPNAKTKPYIPTPNAKPKPFIPTPNAKPKPYIPTPNAKPKPYIPTPNAKPNPYIPTPNAKPKPYIPTPNAKPNPYIPTPNAKPNPYIPTPNAKPKPYIPTPNAKPKPYIPTPNAKPKPYISTPNAKPKPYIPTPNAKPKPYIPTPNAKPKPYIPTPNAKPKPYIPTPNAKPKPYIPTPNAKPKPYIPTPNAKPKPYIPTPNAKPNPYILTPNAKPKPYIPTPNAKPNPYILTPNSKPNPYIPTPNAKPKPYIPTPNAKPKPYIPTPNAKPKPYIPTPNAKPKPYIPTPNAKPNPYIPTPNAKPKPYIPTPNAKPKPYIPTPNAKPKPYILTPNAKPKPLHFLEPKPSK
ncbi:mucin-5AC-like [Ascaphus truei]|uniref:mucin-5AC-like n=1 Tax=Ascaphus truei TaxID=8439 RepID=UPI003F598174